MAKKKRIYSAPLIVAVAAWAGPACSESSTEDPATQTGGTGTGAGNSGGAASGGLGGGDDSGLPVCPDDYAFQYSGCEPGDACKVPMTCTSGTPQTAVLVCREDGLGYSVSDQGAKDCNNPYEACVGSQGTYDCLDDTWVFYGGGGNPPAPCPEVLPDEGSECRFGYGFGADREACGYPCGKGDEGWTVTGCVQGNAGEGGAYEQAGVWTSDGACAAQGGDGGS